MLKYNIMLYKHSMTGFGGFQKQALALTQTDANNWTKMKESTVWKNTFCYWPAIVAAHPPNTNADYGLAVDETAIYWVQKA